MRSAIRSLSRRPAFALASILTVALGVGANTALFAIIYTVLETAKLNRLDPEAYLANIIDRMAKGHPASRLKELLPWNWTWEETPPNQTAAVIS